MTCGRDNIEFIDAELGYNNHCKILIREAQETFPNRQFACILSIGTGLGDVVTISDKRLPILRALKKMASSSKRVADELIDTLPEDFYFRFNVTKGMEDISLSEVGKVSKISAHTKNYIRDVQKCLSTCAGALQNAQNHTRIEARLKELTEEERMDESLKDNVRLARDGEQMNDIQGLGVSAAQRIDNKESPGEVSVETTKLGSYVRLYVYAM